MLHKKSVGVVVPAYNEELLIGRTLQTMPSYVDKIYVVDDCSSDNTVQVVQSIIEQNGKLNKVVLLTSEKNQGVGAAIVNGYYQALKDDVDVVAVMAGDAQMDPDDLETILNPIIEGKADYTKGNRLFYRNAWETIPRYRFIGNSILSLMTKIASGYWKLADSQTGYTAISKKALKVLPLGTLFPRYGYPNHMLVLLNIYNMRVCDVPVKPVYDIGEKSGIRLWKVIPSISFLLLKLFLLRMWEKYIIRDFHPLIFFYSFSFMLFLIGVFLFTRLIIIWAATSLIPSINLTVLTFVLITGMQSLFFAMWFDMDYNNHLNIQ